MKIYDRTDAVSKVQIEIWEIREQMAEVVKEFTLDEKLRYILKESEKARESYDNIVKDRKRRDI